MPTTRFHLVPLSARTSVGATAEATAAAIRAGISRIAEHPFLLDVLGNPLLCGREPTLPAKQLGTSRMATLLDLSLGQVFAKIPALAATGARVPVWLALPTPRPGFTEADARAVAAHLATQLSCPVQPIAEGHAAGMLALHAACDAITTGHIDLALVGAVDSYLSVDTLAWLDHQRRLMRPGVRGGFPPGEGSAFIAIASDDGLRRHGLPSHVRIAGVAMAKETASELSDEGLQGQALTEVITDVAGSFPDARSRFDDVYADINDERARTTDLAFALLRCGALFRDGSQYVSTVESVGELGAVTPVLHGILGARSQARGYARGSCALILGSSWNGIRGAILLERLAAGAATV